MARANLYGSTLREGRRAAALYLPGVAGNNITCPDSAGVSVTGDLDVRVRVRLDDWTPTAATALAAKAGAADSNHSWAFYLDTAGALRLSYSSDGTTVAEAVATSAVTGGTDPLWLRASVDVDNGAGGSTITFYQSTNGDLWESLGAVTVGAIGTLFDSMSALEIGTAYAGTGLLAPLTVHNLALYGAGTLVASWASATAPTRLRDTSGNVWTTNGTSNAWRMA